MTANTRRHTLMLLAPVLAACIASGCRGRSTHLHTGVSDPAPEYRVTLSQDSGHWDDWTTMTLEPLTMWHGPWILSLYAEGHTNRPLGSGAILAGMEAAHEFAVGVPGLYMRLGAGGQFVGPSAHAVDLIHNTPPFEGYDPYVVTPNQAEDDWSLAGLAGVRFEREISPRFAVRADAWGRAAENVSESWAHLELEWWAGPRRYLSFALTGRTYGRRIHTSDQAVVDVLPTGGTVLGFTMIGHWCGGRKNLGIGWWRGWDWGEKLPDHGDDPHPIIGAFYEHRR